MSQRLRLNRHQWEGVYAADFTLDGFWRRVSHLAQTLAAIHGVDIAAVGLDGFGRPDGYLARQLKRWQRQWELSATRDLPDYDRLVDRLAERLPAAGEGTLVHGDFRLDNMLIKLAPRPRVAAVVDWEMSTLGDPLADLGLTLSYWTDPGDSERLGIALAGAITSRPGFLTSAGFARRYAELTGRDVSGIGYYVAFGTFKLADGRSVFAGSSGGDNPPPPKQ